MIKILTDSLLETLNRIPWSPIEWILIASFILFFLIQIWFYLKIFGGIRKWTGKIASKKIELNEENTPVSVIITASNQMDSLAKNLPLILEQEYPEFQVVVVDDASMDETTNLLNELKARYPHLYHTFVPSGVQNISARKIALTVGIKAAKYDVLLFTDANCVPSSDQWIHCMMRQFTPQTNLVLSYKCYDHFNGFFKYLMAYDNLFGAIRYLGMAVAGKPYMGVGQNMAYRKDLFFKHKGFASQLNINTGEDDVFVSAVVQRSSTRIEVSPDAVMYVDSSDSAYRWKEERMNRLQTSKYYKPLARFLISLEVLSRIGCYGLFIALLLVSLINQIFSLLIVAGLFFLIRLIVQLRVVNASARILQEKRFYFSLLLFDLILPFYSFVLRIEGLLKKRILHTRQVLH
jgi:glycosyltransferase involved in cell wall biosynthesis